MKIGINIGPTKQAVKEVGNWIMQILGSGQDQATIQAALTTFQLSCSVSGTVISNANIIDSNVNDDNEDGNEDVIGDDD